MGECGCVIPNVQYKLEGPEGYVYLITIHGGCRYCPHPPGLSVEKYDEDSEYLSEADEFGDVESLESKMIDTGDFETVTFVTQPHIGEFVERFTRTFSGVTDFDKGLLEIMAEDFWKDSVVNMSPEVVENVEKQ